MPSFFPALEERYAASNGEESAAEASLPRNLRPHPDSRAAERLLDKAIETVPCPAIHRPRARARATSAFWGRLRGPKSVFSDQPEIFAAREAENAA